LGYPGVYSDSIPFVTGAIEALGTREDEVTLVREILTRLTAIEAELDGSVKRMKVKVVGKITLAQLDEIKALRKEGGRLCGELSIKFSVPLGSKYFQERGANVQTWPDYNVEGGSGNRMRRG